LWRSVTSGVVFWAFGTAVLWVALQFTGRYGLSLFVATALTTPFTFVFKYVVNKYYVFGEKK
jgi:putative flippase GtrA